MSGIAAGMRRRLRRPTLSGLDCLVIGVGLAVLAVGLILARLHPVGYLGVETDFFGTYGPQARNLLSRDSFSAPHAGPGYPVLLSLVALVVGDIFAAGKVITAIAGCLLIWLSYDLVRRLFDRVVATAAALVLALLLVPVSYLAATDVPGAVVALVPIWILVREREPSLRDWFIAGSLAGLAYLFRHNFVFVVISVPLAALILNPRYRSWKQGGARSALALGGALLVILPWFVYSWSLRGEPLAGTVHAQIAAHFFHPEGDVSGTALRQVAGQFDSVWEVITNDPVHVATTYARGLYRNSRSLFLEGLEFPALIFAGGGLVVLAMSLTRRVAVLLAWAILGYMLLALVGFYLRYYFFLFPVLTLLVAAALFPHRVWRDSKDRLAVGDRWGWLFLFVIFLPMAYGTARGTASDLAEEPLYILEMAEILRARANPGDTIIVRKPHVAFHADLHPVFPLAETAADFQMAAERVGARFLAYSRSEARLWPGLEEFGDSTSASRLGFRVLYASADADAILYELEPPSR